MGGGGGGGFTGDQPPGPPLGYPTGVGLILTIHGGFRRLDLVEVDKVLPLFQRIHETTETDPLVPGAN